MHLRRTSRKSFLTQITFFFVLFRLHIYTVYTAVDLHRVGEMSAPRGQRCTGITEGHERVQGQVKWYDAVKVCCS